MLHVSRSHFSPTLLRRPSQQNFSYLEYPALGHMPDPPVNGYQPGRADVGELCCPCFHPALVEDGGDDEYGSEAQA